MLTHDELLNLSEIKLEEINKHNLKELTDIHLDSNMTIEEKIKTFLDKIENPYIFLVHGTPVQISFNNHNKTKLDDCLLQYLTKKGKSDNFMI